MKKTEESEALYMHIYTVWKEKRDKGETDLGLGEWVKQALFCGEDEEETV